MTLVNDVQDIVFCFSPFTPKDQRKPPNHQRETQSQQNNSNINDPACVISVSLSNQVNLCGTAGCWVIGYFHYLLFTFKWCCKIFIQCPLYHTISDTNLFPLTYGQPKAYIMLFQLSSCAGISQSQQNGCNCAVLGQYCTVSLSNLADCMSPPRQHSLFSLGSDKGLTSVNHPTQSTQYLRWELRRHSLFTDVATVGECN